MEELSSALAGYVQGLQESFGQVFAKVGTSLEQSQHMMHMMNEMMEMALVQNVQINWRLSGHLILEVTVTNNSRIVLEQASIEIQTETGTVPASPHALSQLIPMASETTSFALEPTEFQAQSGVIRVVFPSPGTKAPMTRTAAFAISCMQLCRVEPKRVSIQPSDTATRKKGAHCEGIVSADSLRTQLELSAFDGLLLHPEGFYRLVPLGADKVSLTLYVSEDDEERGRCRVQVVSDQEQSSSFIAAFAKEFAHP